MIMSMSIIFAIFSAIVFSCYIVQNLKLNTDVCICFFYFSEIFFSLSSLMEISPHAVVIYELVFKFQLLFLYLRKSSAAEKLILKTTE